jgi:hypothetical protein
MAKDRSLVRASDIGAWAFCRRAWYLAQVRGVAHSRPEVLRRGTEAHSEHGRQVRRASRLQRMGVGLVIFGILFVLLLMVATVLGWGF